MKITTHKPPQIYRSLTSVIRINVRVKKMMLTDKTALYGEPLVIVEALGSDDWGVRPKIFLHGPPVPSIYRSITQLQNVMNYPIDQFELLDGMEAGAG